MYSSSNSFLGGANSARPGLQSPFGQQPVYSQFPQGQQQQQLQPTSLAPQPTGFPGGQLQPQFTGFPGAAGPQQGFNNFGQQQQQQPYLQPQFTGLPPQSQPPQVSLQQSAPQQYPTSTGAPSISVQKTSSQIAQSFKDLDASSKPQPPPKSGSKIPNIRLSFITAQDQAKFEQLFKAAAGDSQTLDGL